MIDVTDYGASPSASATTNGSAFSSARTAAGASGVIYWPPGSYAVPSGLDFSARIVRGGCAHASTRTVLVAADSTNDHVARATSRFEVEGIVFDGNGLVDYGLKLTSAHSAIVRNVQAVDCEDTGIYVVNSCNARFEKLVAEDCPRGLMLAGCNATVVSAVVVDARTGETGCAALEIHGKQYDSVFHAGSVWVNGCNLSVGTDSRPQIWIRGAAGAAVRDVYSEGGAAQIALVSDDAHNCRFVGLNGSGSGDEAYRVEECRHVAIVDCYAGTGYGDGIVWTGDANEEPIVRDCRLFSTAGDLPLVVTHET